MYLQAVVFIFQHSSADDTRPQGSAGLILNRPTQVSTSSVCCCPLSRLPQVLTVHIGADITCRAVQFKLGEIAGAEVRLHALACASWLAAELASHLATLMGRCCAPSLPPTRFSLGATSGRTRSCRCTTIPALQTHSRHVRCIVRTLHVRCARTETFLSGHVNVFSACGCIMLLAMRHGRSSEACVWAVGKQVRQRSPEAA